jgi:hypothetical protein
MATVTPNFNWPVPTSTDLVKDGATAIEALGDSIDASLVDLKGGTTGQVLSKTSNTDMDFTWVTTDDANAIQNSIVDAKGDLISATGNDTPARLAVGNNGETLVADSSTSTGLRYTANFAAGKNKIINGDFNIWQRGTSFSNPGTNAYVADRFKIQHDGTGATRTVSQQTFTPGTAPVAGYEGSYFLRYNVSAAGTGNSYNIVIQPIEDVRTFANQPITVSFWAKSDSARTVYVDVVQDFGSGGSATVSTGAAASQNTSTSWQRFSFNITVPTISGKTIGTSSNILIRIWTSGNTTFTTDIWGVQAEAGSVATAFQTATGTLQGELAACQRYYYVYVDGTSSQSFGTAGYYSSTDILTTVSYPVTMRTAPTFSVVSGGNYYEVVRNSGSNTLTGLQANYLTSKTANIFAGSAQGASGTAGHAGQFRTISVSANAAFSAEL